MPIFEYECNKCGHKFENLSFSSSPSEKVLCTSCESENVKKLLSVFATGSEIKGDFACQNPSSCPASGQCPGSCGAH
jgi:putative FmdB family regulatory protein